ncbi:MAG: hypothetical protein AAGE84_23090 [Cyanobacteria bacterium P01_G01_bin.39]
MKLITIATLSAIALSNLGTAALADKADKVAVGSTFSANIVEISPINLVSAAYQGRFTDQAIPSNSALLSAIRGNRIKAEDLIKAGIDSGRLSEQTLNDESYISSLESSIDRFKRRRL